MSEVSTKRIISSACLAIQYLTGLIESVASANTLTDAKYSVNHWIQLIERRLNEIKEAVKDIPN